MVHPKSSIATSLALLAAASVAPAAIITTTGSFSDVTISETYDGTQVHASPGFILTSQPITGLTKFNPAQGVLNSITLDVSTDWDWEFSVSADSSIESSLPSSADVYIEFIQFFIGYYDGVSSTSVLANADENASVSTSADAGDSLFGSNYYNGNISESADITGIGTLSDFIGTGALTSLGGYLALPTEVTSFTLDNVDPPNAFATLDMRLNGANVTLTYDYTVPEPASFSLLALGGLALLRRRRAA